MNSIVRAWSILTAIVLVLSSFVFMPGFTAVQAAGPTELFFSEYVEGSSYNKALEIFNGTGAAVELAAGGYNIQMYFNGNTTSTYTITLTGSVAHNDAFVITPTNANSTLLALADQTDGIAWFNGDDTVVLRKGETVIDVFGQIGVDPGTEWVSGAVSTADNTLRRKASVLTGDTNSGDAFDPALEWDVYAQDTFDGLGSHSVTIEDTAPTVTSTTPANGEANFPIASNLSVTFSEPVDTAADWASLTCTTGGSLALAISGGPATFTLDPLVNLLHEDTCTLTVEAEKITDQDANDPPNAMASDYVISFTAKDVCQMAFTEIPAIQGSGPTAAITGTVTTQGVVVGDYEGASPTLRGFYLQSLAGDGNPATSDGIFVYNASNNSVSLGDVVRVTGNAGENFEQTQISASSIAACGTGSAAPVDVTLPFSSSTDLERYEGMLVRLPQTLVVTEHYLLGRFGQVLVSSGGRLSQPTNVVLPGAEALALQAANNLNRILIDDALNSQNPDPIVFGRGGLPLSASNTLRGGDTITGAVGVLTYTWGGHSASPNAYRLRPVNALGAAWNFTAVNARPENPAPVGGTLRVSAFNLLNYFNTFDGDPDAGDFCTLGVGGASTDCRGADTQAEFDRQYPKIVAAILKIDAAVVGLVEIENDGYGAESAIAHLVDQLNLAAGAATYAYIDADTATGQVNALGVDAIKVGLIYQPGLVTPVGTTAALNSVAFVNGGDGEARNRPALAQTFEETFTGERFTVVVNHLKSKGSACDVAAVDDGQGECNIVRTNAANAMAAWLGTDPTATGETDILIMGDLNAYAKEDPVAALETAGFTNMLAAFAGINAYTYVFDGQWGYLDHALASSTLIDFVTGVTAYHINADEPSVLDYNTNFKTPGQVISLYAADEFRASDHDAIIVGLNFLPIKLFLPIIGR